MTTQPKSVHKLIFSILLVAVILLTSCFGCAVAYADSNVQTYATYTVTYKWTEGDGTAKQSTQSGLSLYQPFIFPTTQEVAWFTFDGWYTDEARTTKAPSLLLENANKTLYGAYVFNVGAGDVNGDGKVNSDDIDLYRKHVVGGHGIVPVASGSEWAVATSSDFSASTKYFLEGVSNIASGSSYLRNLSTIRMAIVGGFDMRVYNGGIYNESDESATETVYYYNGNGWATPHIYAWGGDDVEVEAWPGAAMTAVTGKSGWYSAQIPARMNNPKVIFNDGKTQNADQTADLSFDVNSPYYYYGTWCSDLNKLPTTKRMYYYNENGWSQVYAHHWYTSNGSDIGTTWPGVAMTRLASNSNVYYVDVPINREKIIFHNNSGWQTDNLQFSNIKTYYRMGTWYDFNDTYTIYYYGAGAGNVYAHYWDNNDKNDYSWPGVLMTSLSDKIGWYTIEVPVYMSGILFTRGTTDDLKLAIDLTINSDSIQYFYVSLVVDGVPYYMAPNLDNTNDNACEYKILGVSLKAGQKISVSRFGKSSTFQNDISNCTSYTLTADGTYDFYCDASKTWVVKK